MNLTPTEYALATAIAVICLLIVCAVIGWMQRQEADELQHEMEKANADYYRRQRLMAGPAPRPQWPSAEAMPVQLFDQPKESQ